MPFEPLPFRGRLIHPEEPLLDEAGELQLPDDLAALAEQLSDDAQYLAAQVGRDFHCPSDRMGRTRIAHRRAYFAAAAALVVLAVTVGIAYITQQAELNLAQPGAGVASAGASGEGRGRARETVVGDSAAPFASLQGAPAGETYQASTEASLVLLGGASGPEREALLDLLEQDESAQNSISF